MDCHFLTCHGTFLCFGTDNNDFRHIALEDLDDAALVTGDAACEALRHGSRVGQPLAIRPYRRARMGVPRALGVGPGVRPGTISLIWRDANLCADGLGGTIRTSVHVDAWEEFLPVDAADLGVLRALNQHGWEWDRTGEPFGAGQIRIGRDFTLHAGALALPLDRLATLGGAQALRDGRVSLLADGWRIETLRRWNPLIVWRHDGSEGADAEIVLGLISLIAAGGHGFRLLVETRLSREDLMARAPGLDRLDVALAPPREKGGLLPLRTVADGVPALHLSNGVVCRGPLARVLRALLDEQDVALMPWIWNAADPQGTQSLFWADDPLENETSVLCGTSIIGVPNGERAMLFASLIEMIAANRLAGVRTDDAIERDLLRYVAARAGGGSSRLLARHVADANQAWGHCPLVDFRSVPVEIRQDAMQSAIDGTD